MDTIRISKASRRLLLCFQGLTLLIRSWDIANGFKLLHFSSRCDEVKFLTSWSEGIERSMQFELRKAPTTETSEMGFQ